ncbi:hypothetical protein [Streptomyces mirabilis]|uniref:hypothetical protein n=1 Tax=Streptomyces mirabilis TaxID=68239 RepID=UPI0033B12369
MTVAVWIFSLLLMAEFVVVPINLWTGRNVPFFQKSAGHAPAPARRVFAPVKLAGVMAVAVGIVPKPVSIAGGAILAAVCGYYLVRLAAARRRDSSGIFAFLLFGSWSVALLVVRIS